MSRRRRPSDLLFLLALGGLLPECRMEYVTPLVGLGLKFGLHPGNHYASNVPEFSRLDRHLIEQAAITLFGGTHLLLEFRFHLPELFYFPFQYSPGLRDGGIELIHPGLDLLDVPIHLGFSSTQTILGLFNRLRHRILQFLQRQLLLVGRLHIGQVVFGTRLESAELVARRAWVERLG